MKDCTLSMPHGEVGSSSFWMHPSATATCSLQQSFAGAWASRLASRGATLVNWLLFSCCMPPKQRLTDGWQRACQKHSPCSSGQARSRSLACKRASVQDKRAEVSSPAVPRNHTSSRYRHICHATLVTVGLIESGALTERSTFHRPVKFTNLP